MRRSSSPAPTSSVIFEARICKALNEGYFVPYYIVEVAAEHRQYLERRIEFLKAFVDSAEAASSAIVAAVTIGLNVHRSIHLQHRNHRALDLTAQLYAYLKGKKLLDREILLPDNIMVSRISAFVERQLEGLS